jgi:type III pantothenate kinase
MIWEEGLVLAIGNSRLHWAWLEAGKLRQTWDTEHFSPPKVRSLIQSQLPFPNIHGQTPPNLWIVSVVPAQTQLWQDYPRSRVLTLADIPLQNTYPTLGIDRAIALWGAIQTYGSPVLVIDGGTALTFTGADQTGALVGGAIFPGVRSLFQTLNQSTAALPLGESNSQIPDRWSRHTPTAIQSGISHILTAGIIDFIQDWQRQYPNSAIVLTGGDATIIHQWLTERAPAMAAQTQVNPQLVFVGVQAVLSQNYPAADGN